MTTEIKRHKILVSNPLIRMNSRRLSSSTHKQHNRNQGEKLLNKSTTSIEEMDNDPQKSTANDRRGKNSHRNKQQTPKGIHPPHREDSTTKVVSNNRNKKPKTNKLISVGFDKNVDHIDVHPHVIPRSCELSQASPCKMTNEQRTHQTNTSQSDSSTVSDEANVSLKRDIHSHHSLFVFRLARLTYKNIR